MPSPRPKLRVAVFTADANLESTEWWRLLAEDSHVEQIIVVRVVQRRDLRMIASRARRNIRRHGLVFIPYRLGHALLGAVRRLRGGHPDPEGAPGRASAPHSCVEAADIHSDEVVRRLAEWSPDIGFAIGAPVLRERLFSLPRLGTLNLHLGQVPYFRGAPPGFWELHEGATEIGATVHFVNAGLDTGPVVASATAPLYTKDDFADVEARVHELGRAVFSNALRRVFAGDATAIAQPVGGRTFRQPLVAVRLGLSVRLLRQQLARTVLRPVWLAKSGAAAAALMFVRPLRDLWRSARGVHPVRIFTYHRVSELCRDGMTISQRSFRDQVDYLARTHRVLPLEAALDLLKAKERLFRPVAVITFDDAYLSVWEEAAPILARAGLPATVFVSTGMVDTNRRFEHDESSPVREFLSCMTWGHLERLVASGWSLGAHTANHVRLSETPSSAYFDEIEQPLRVLRERIGAKDLTLAYPFGQETDISSAAIEAARAAGYCACFSDSGGENPPTDGEQFEYRRIDVGGDHPILSWKAMIHGFRLNRYRWNRT